MLLYSVSTRGSEKVNNGSRRTFVNPRRHIRTVPVAQAHLRPLQRRCPSEKKLKHKTKESLVHNVLHSAQQLTTRGSRKVWEWKAVEVAS